MLVHRLFPAALISALCACSGTSPYHGAADAKSALSVRNFSSGATTTSDSTGKTLTLQLPPGTQQYDVLVALLTQGASNQTFTPPTGWTAIPDAIASVGTSSIKSQAYYKVAGAS